MMNGLKESWNMKKKRDVDVQRAAGMAAPPSARMADNARALAKFERPKNACVFEGGRIWLSPHGRARHRAQLARAKPEEPPRGGGDAALTRLLSDGRMALV